jgi:orotidine-5'-phosphate decarboxylase
MVRIIERDQSIIVACDVKSIEDLEKLIEKSHSVEGIGGYKVGSILTIRYGLQTLINTIREFTDLPVIYDHQKAMTDIPELGKGFATTVKEAGADALIGFPQSGPVTQEQWTKACNDINLSVIIGGEMTHAKYKRSEGGYIVDQALDETYLLAARMGINNFVVPGNRTERIAHYRNILEPLMQDDMILYAPGFIAQGGSITETARAAGDFWHAIVGRAIYEAKDVTLATKEMTREILR